MRFGGQTIPEKYLEKFARLGLTMKGIVYCLIALITFITALGLSTENGDKEAVFEIIYHQTFGEVLLVLIGVSLIGYVTLRFFQAFNDINHKGKSIRGLFRRAGYAISGVIHLGLSFYAFKIAFDFEAGDEDTKKVYIGKVLELPGGAFAIGAVAAIVIGQGIYQIYRGLSSRFMKRVELHRSGFSGTFKKIGMAGHAARGLVLCIIGFFLARAAINSNAREAEGTAGAFDFLQYNFGNILVGTVALGLFAYGLFMFVRARHEKIGMRI